MKIFKFYILILFFSSCGQFSVTDPSPSGQQPSPPKPDLTGNNPALNNDIPLIVNGAGQLKAYQDLKAFSTAEFETAWGSQADWPLSSKYEVKTYKIDYLTTHTNGELIQASGLIALPVLPTKRPLTIISYQHGTIFRNADAPSLALHAREAPIFLASLGFAVVAADYIGYGTSQGLPHPYLQSAPSANSVIDLLVAARVWFQRHHVNLTQKLILIGYSQGAHVSMAAHRQLQNSPNPYLPMPTMMISGGGPYNVKATLDGILNLVREKEPVLGALVDPNVLEHLGSSLRRRVRDAILKEIIPSGSDIVLDSRFLDLYLADRKSEIDLVSNVHQWNPTSPIYMMHAPNDLVVPYESSLSTLRYMQNINSFNSNISLKQCPSNADSHIGCVAPFFKYALEVMAFSGLEL